MSLHFSCVSFVHEVESGDGGQGSDVGKLGGLRGEGWCLDGCDVGGTVPTEFGTRSRTFGPIVRGGVFFCETKGKTCFYIKTLKGFMSVKGSGVPHFVTPHFRRSQTGPGDSHPSFPRGVRRVDGSTPLCPDAGEGSRPSLSEVLFFRSTERVSTSGDGRTDLRLYDPCGLLSGRPPFPFFFGSGFPTEVPIATRGPGTRGVHRLLFVTSQVATSSFSRPRRVRRFHFGSRPALAVPPGSPVTSRQAHDQTSADTPATPSFRQYPGDGDSPHPRRPVAPSDPPPPSESRRPPSRTRQLPIPRSFVRGPGSSTIEGPDSRPRPTQTVFPVTLDGDSRLVGTRPRKVSDPGPPSDPPSEVSSHRSPSGPTCRRPGDPRDEDLPEVPVPTDLESDPYRVKGRGLPGVGPRGSENPLGHPIQD